MNDFFDDVFVVIMGLVIAWYVLKGLYFLLLAVWEEVGPAVRVLWRAVKWLLYLPFAPLVALWFLLAGRPETEAERWQREAQEARGREVMSREQSDRQREEQLEAIRKALKID